VQSFINFASEAFMPISAGDLAIVTKAALDDYMRNRPVDQIGTERPFIKKLMAGRKKLMPARQYAIENVRNGYGGNFAWSYGEAARSFNSRDTVEQAQFPWRVALDGFYLDWDKLFSAGIRVDPDMGSHGKLKLESNERAILYNIMEEQVESLELGFIEKLDKELHRSGASSADAIVGLDALISPTPSSGAIGGLDPSTRSWWQNGFEGTVSAANLKATLERQWRRCIRNGGAPDFILAGSTFIDTYAGSLTLTQNTDAGKPKTVDVATGRGSETGLFYKGVPIVWDPVFSELDTLEAPASTLLWEKRCYFINTKHLKYEDDGMMVYNPTPPHNVRATYTSLDLRCALKTNRRNAHALTVVTGS
jgi:hypothetical protein